MARHGSLAEQLATFGTPKAANDNKPAKPKPVRYRGTLPALRWLHDNHPDLAPALAAAMPKPATSWSAEAGDNKQEIRPTIGELLKAASDAFRVFALDGVGHDRSGLSFKREKDDLHATMGNLKFINGRLTEWAVTKKGKKLRPVDRIRSDGEKRAAPRNNAFYLATKATQQSPMHADPLPRNTSGLPAISSMYDPQAGVEAGRALLRSLGVDGSVSADHLPFPVTKCPTAVASGASFLGGVSRSSGTASSGAKMWELPEDRKGDAATVIEEVAARGTLKSIGIRLGYSEAYADQAGKAALIEAARILAAANNNKKQ